ncbi:hypothetical protein [Mesoterricola silvestris]|uniref:Membrane protein n=1 Tax=Mesoterricola silvestris TaxID=2927979 RepID=A0AA48GQ86_9BACT|nr:hypothetical protein [Mesoterricola silvestris]BDU74114.1 membrane protein [Mesoterricola silvestris]
MSMDLVHLRRLEIAHYAAAGSTWGLSSLFLIHVYLGWSSLHGAGPFLGTDNPPPPAGYGFGLMAVGLLAVGAGWLFGAAIAYSGYSMGRRRNHKVCLVIAGLMCVMCNPVSTTLGLFTFLILLRPSVGELFQPPAGRPTGS